MTRRQIIVMSTAAGILVLLVFVLIGANRRHALKRAVPAWLIPNQPPEGIAADLPTLSEAESWAANRCRPMVASCGTNTAGRRIRREYPPSLAESPDSFIRASFKAEI